MHAPDPLVRLHHVGPGRKRVAGTVLYFRLIQGPGPTFVSLVNYIVPGWAVIAGSVVLGETLSLHVFAGLALILMSLATSEFGGRLSSLLQQARIAPTPTKLASEDA